MAFMPFGKALLCRETQRFWDFLGGVHPVELVLGFVSGLWRGIGESAVLGIVQVSVHVNVKRARGQIVALDLRSGLVLGDSYDDRFSKQHVCVAGIFLFLNPGGGHSLSGTVLGEIIGLSRRTGLSTVSVVAVWRASKRAKPSAWDAPP